MFAIYFLSRLPLISRNEELKYLCRAEPWSARQIHGKDKGTERAVSQPSRSSKLHEGIAPTLRWRCFSSPHLCYRALLRTFTVSSQGKIQCSSKTKVASECQDTVSEIFPLFFFFFSCRGSVHRSGTKKPSRHGRLTALCRHEGRRKQDTSGIYFKTLSCIWMAAGAKTNHAVEEVQKQNKERKQREGAWNDKQKR